MKILDIKLLSQYKYNRKCRYSNINLNNLRISVIYLNSRNRYLHNSVRYNQNRIFIDVLEAFSVKSIVISLKYTMQGSYLIL